MIISALTGEKIEEPIYSSKSGRSITSLSQVHNGNTRVYYDSSIGHLQTNEIADLDKYYDEEYQIFDESDEDDILYKIIDGKKMFRQQHQVDTLFSKVEIRPGLKILDYGCAKGTVLKRLYAQVPDIVPYLFDVSKMYVRLWGKFVKPEQYASYTPKKEWEHLFDIVTSFFAFEHTPDPLKELDSIKNLLRPGGLVYMIVPNVYENIGDFIVADHIHHYSELSLNFMFSKAGFEIIEIDASSHFAAYIIIARSINSELSFPADQKKLADIQSSANDMAKYWENLQLKISDFEHSVSDKKAAIYGAGVYGTFIASSLKDINKIQCFIDQNPLCQGKTIMGKPVVLPENRPEEINVMYVGLNPKSAKNSIESLGWQLNNQSIFYL